MNTRKIRNGMALLIAWAWIAVPLGWGVFQSVQKSMPLFGDLSSPQSTGNQK